MMPMAGVTTPMPVTGPQAASIKEQSDFDGPLVDYKTKGYTLELVGTEPLGDRKVYHLRLTSAAKTVQHVYIDTETNLERKISTETPMGDIEQELSDYRTVEGVKVPFRSARSPTDSEQTRIVVDKVEIESQARRRDVQDAQRTLRKPKGKS